MVMTLALLVYSIAQRRLRTVLKSHNQTISNQIGKPSQTPTMRSIFQLMEGLDFVTIAIDGIIRKVVHGWDEIKKTIVTLMGKTVMHIYGLLENPIFDLGG